MENSRFQERWIILLLFLTGTVLTLPAFFSDFYTGHNVLTHLMWSKHFAEQLWGGDLYPRWLMNMNGGLGSPAFYFYFPLPFYITSIFHAPFFSSGDDGWLALGLSCAAAYSLSGATCYAWLRNTVDQRASALGALVYMLLPYHLLVDLYYRFAFTEFWAFVFMPLCLLSADRIRHGKRYGIPGTAICYALLFLTHLPTILIFSPLLFFYVMLPDKNEKVGMPLLRLSCALLLGAGLSAFYWLPAISTQSNVSFAMMSQGDFHFKKNFLFSLLDNHPKRTELGSYHFFVTYSTLFTLAVCMVSWMAMRGATRLQGGKRNFWLGVGIVAFFMMLDLSSWLWQSLPLLERIQFPYRFNLLLALSVTVLTAWALQSDAKNLTRKFWALIVGSFIITQIVISVITIHQASASQWPPEIRKTIEKELSLSPEVKEYLPSWATKDLFPVTLSEEVLNRFPTLEIIDGEGEVDVVSWEAGRIILRSTAATPIALVVKHLYYPNWNATVGEDHQALSVSPSVGQGFISVNIPAGSHQVILCLEPGTEEVIGGMLSILSLIVLAILSGRFFRSQK